MNPDYIIKVIIEEDSVGLMGDYGNSKRIGQKVKTVMEEKGREGRDLHRSSTWTALPSRWIKAHHHSLTYPS